MGIRDKLRQHPGQVNDNDQSQREPEDLPKINVPVLLQHGQEDVSGPLILTAQKSRDLIRECALNVYRH